MLKNHTKSGFTLVELVVIGTIILILAGVAITQGVSTQRSLRHRAAFDAAIGMIQEARTMAQTGEDTGDTAYGVAFVANSTPQQFVLFKNSYAANGSNNISTPYSLANYLTLDMGSCLSEATVAFSVPEATTQLTCDGVASSTPSMTVRLSLTGGGTRRFTIHRATGIPQVE
ncbi:MAG: type II secretion system protein [Patescibacteria group bacterium]